MSFRAVVHNGRLVMDEPTQLPEGLVLDLVADDEGDDLDEVERAALESHLAVAFAEADAGLGRPVEEVLAEIRGQRRSL